MSSISDERVEAANDEDSKRLRATFIHPDGREHRSPYGEVVLTSSGVAHLPEKYAPDWIGDPGVEVVVADENGNVEEAFTIGGLTGANGIVRIHS